MGCRAIESACSCIAPRNAAWDGVGLISSAQNQVRKGRALFENELPLPVSWDTRIGFFGFSNDRRDDSCAGREVRRELNTVQAQSLSQRTDHRGLLGPGAPSNKK